MRVLLIVVLASPIVFAQSNRQPWVSFGNDFLQNCKDYVEADNLTSMDHAQSLQFGYCAGYTAGLWEMLLLTNKNDICASDKIQTVQVARVITKWIKDHPEQAHELTVLLARRALTQAFPCSKK